MADPISVSAAEYERLKKADGLLKKIFSDEAIKEVKKSILKLIESQLFN